MLHFHKQRRRNGSRNGFSQILVAIHRHRHCGVVNLRTRQRWRRLSPKPLRQKRPHFRAQPVPRSLSPQETCRNARHGLIAKLQHRLKRLVFLGMIWRNISCARQKFEPLVHGFPAVERLARDRQLTSGSNEYYHRKKAEKNAPGFPHPSIMSRQRRKASRIWITSEVPLCHLHFCARGAGSVSQPPPSAL